MENRNDQTNFLRIMIKMRILCVLVLFLKFTTAVSNLSAEGLWTYYTDGNAINGITVHGDYIYCATKGGLIRWNRHNKTYERYLHIDPEVCCEYQLNNFYAITASNDGVVWCGNNHYNLFSYDSESWKLYTNKNSELPGKAGKLNTDQENLLWISTSKGIICFDYSNWTTYTEDGSGNSLLYMLDIDRDNVKWFRTDAGVSSFDGSSWVAYTHETGLPDTEIINMAADADNVKWFTVASPVLLSFDGTTWKTHEDLEWSCSSIAVDNENVVWCGSNNGLVSFNGSDWTYYTESNSGLPSSDVRLIVVDEDGVKWISTIPVSQFAVGTGLTRFDGSVWSTWRIDGPIDYNTVSVAVDHSNVKWFGGMYNGLSCFDGSGWKTYTLPDTTMITEDSTINVENTIVCISEDYNNILWLGYYTHFTEFKENDHTTWDASGVMDFDGLSFTKYPEETTGYGPWMQSEFTVDHDNVKWFDTTSFDDTTWKTYTEDGFGNTIGKPVAVDRNNVKWFGVPGGVSNFDGFKWEYHQIDGLTDAVRKIVVNSNNVKWLVSKKSEVFSYDGNSWVQHQIPETVRNLKPGHTVTARDDCAVDGNDVVWFLASEYDPGFAGGGLLSFDGDTWIYHRDDFWLAYAAGRMAIDHNNVKWIVSHSGIARYDGGSNGDGQTVVDESNISPGILSISPNYPNPFNLSTTISFALPSNGFTELVIYDILGRRVRELLSKNMIQGTYSILWNGRDDTGFPVSSGVYISHLKMGGYTASAGMLLMK